MKTQSNTTTRTRRMVSLVLALIGMMFLFAATAQASTYTVISADDVASGGGCGVNHCSLREAITASNVHPGADTITFNIPFSGVQTIIPATPLPAITDTVTIDGYTQAGAKANTLAVGDDAVFMIEINGAADNSVSSSIFFLAAPNCTIRGLALNRSKDYGIYVNSNGNLITGNFIGTDPTGVFAQPNGVSGIYISGVSNNVIGGISPSARNLISGNTYPINTGAGIEIFKNTATNNKIQGNYIGTGATGIGALANHQIGIYMQAGTHGNIVGGTTAGAGNVISGNSQDGVEIVDSSSNVIEGNLIGMRADGFDFTVPNNYGIAIIGASNANKIGDAVANAGNVISGNTQSGILFYGGNSGNPTLNEVFNNFIGTQADGASDIGNGTNGVELSNGATGNYIGSFTTGAANVIAFNGVAPNFGGSGVRVLKDAGTGNSINGNSIHHNHDLGIDLEAPADTSNQRLTPNDLNDADTGANSLQNFPVITSAVSSNGTTTITGTLNSTANEPFRIEFFASPDCSASGNGEGKTFLGSTNVTTSGNNAAFNASFPGFTLNQFVTATATDLGPLNTSEFSQCMQVAAPGQGGPGSFTLAAGYSVNEQGGMATITVTRSGGSSGAVSVHYATSDGTAKAGSDYTATSGTLQFANGVTTATFTIPLNDDSVFEGNETVNLALSNPQGGATLGNQSASVLTIIDNEQQPAIAISDSIDPEDNSGSDSAFFNVTLSNASTQPVTVAYATADGTATSGSGDYQAQSGTLTFAPGEVSKSILVAINGDTTPEPDETYFVNLSNPVNANINRAQGTGVIINDDVAPTPTPSPTPTPGGGTTTVQFSVSNYDAQESANVATITVKRTGDLSQRSSVDYATTDINASERGDYTTSLGTLYFAPGETQKIFDVLLTDDAYTEADEQVQLTLSNPTGGSTQLGNLSTATLTILANDSVPSNLNPADDAQSFVRQHYHDFLNREPDAAGLQFWTNEIASCGANADCTSAKRESVSAAFFLSIEFQQTGYLVTRFNLASYGKMPRYREFLRDTQAIGRGVVVGQGNWQVKLEANKQALADRWVVRPEFVAAFGAMTDAQYVDALFANAGVQPTPAERDALVNRLQSQSETRATVLRQVAEHSGVVAKAYAPSFVLMQYVGYLRRNADDAPDVDMSGYNFWLTKLNQFGGDYQKSQMVKAFIVSTEFRQRFGLQ